MIALFGQMLAQVASLRMNRSKKLKNKLRRDRSGALGRYKVVIGE